MQYCTLLTYLNNSVFRLCQKLQTITLPPNLKEIGSGSLGWCGLRSITIPNSVVKIHHWSSQDGGAFTGSLYSVTINPESNLEIIGTESFVSSKIKSIFIPKKVTELYGSCFHNVFLDEIIIDAENQKFKSDKLSIYGGVNNDTLVYVSSKFTGNYVVENFVSKIGASCFADCKLSSITFHENVSSIGGYCFADSSLVEIVLPKKVVTVGNYVFRGCQQLRSVTLSNATTTIYSGAFYNCISLTRIVFPSTLASIGESVFYGCKNLVIDSSQNSNFNYDNQMLLSNKKTTIIEFFGNDVNLEITAPPETTTIGARTFMNKKLKTIKFQGNSLRYIGEYCFSQSTIQSITFPDSLNNLGKGCFENCLFLTSISFANSCPLTVISEICFNGCKNLQIITLSGSITTIKAYAFCNCYSISDIGIRGTQVSNIEIFCFMNSGITKFSSSNKITFGYGAFSNSNIAEVNILADSISEECFKNCTMLTSLTLNEGITTIYESAFRDCVSLSSFTIPASIRQIRSYAFMGCTSLKTVTLSLNSQISEINGGIFADCPLLQSIKLDANDKQYRFANGALTYYNETKIITFIPSSDIQTFVVPAAMEKNRFIFFLCMYQFSQSYI
ncbi:surface antigen BspA-like [Trichomonas vaginalis G3]|uniref:Surface antigen BspA-like n=1 Tax=Trichomonas vaginalis (strain ATCC PRA-98 / G3) TaxID=412133 RepID=A2FZL0_TRIV3|nr:structural constituent of cell wall [Trichomonas vaginalis G3]EAX89668.1 surface antigen BspA-like [Trichomonas vaginalis G3]KAI5495868.1 structural constituent of cell wall [Trichomonas vaginalis G3]|eukprot:XP_001302598.1 surface antigen BspA-like [Trichomonas vaginalis G3]